MFFQPDAEMPESVISPCDGDTMTLPAKSGGGA